MARPRDEYDFSPSTTTLTPSEKLYQYNQVVTNTGNVPTASIETFGGTASDFIRNPAQEAAAIAAGVGTKAEIEARGGVNASGYYGDSYDSQRSLTDAEYRAAVAGKTGAEQGAAINAALEAKMAKNFPSGAASGGTSTGAIAAQNANWTSFLAGVGTVGFGGNYPIADTGSLNGGNFYRLSNVFKFN